MEQTEQQKLAERIVDRILFISGINQPGKLMFPAMSENELAGCYNRSELIDLILDEIRKTPA